jgi:tetratricopeptide (TPR) repeat protein
MITIGAAWFIVTISIYLSIVALASDIFAERFLFFPSIGLCLIVGGLLECIPSLDTRKQTIVAAVLVVPLLFMSVKRVPAWENTEALLEHDIDKLEFCVRANYNYALLLHQKYDNFPNRRKRGDEQLILKHYQLALNQTDRLSNLYLAMGNAYMRFGQREKGRSTFLAFAKAYPQLSKPFTQLGNYYATSEQPDSAICYFQKALDVGNINSENYQNLGVAYMTNNQPEKAIEVLLKGEPYASDNPKYYRKFTAVCVKANRYDLGAEILNKGLLLFPQDETLRDYQARFIANGWIRPRR